MRIGPLTANQAAEQALIQESVTMRSCSAPCILVTDDEAAIKDLICEILESSGYTVYAAADGRQAITCLRLNRIDLLITDLVMPEQEGLETIRLARQIQPDIKVLAMSGGTNVYLRMAGLLGASATLRKPFSMDELSSTVEHLVGRATNPHSGGSQILEDLST